MSKLVHRPAYYTRNPDDFNHSMIVVGKSGDREQPPEETWEEYAKRLRHNVTRTLKPSRTWQQIRMQ